VDVRRAAIIVLVASSAWAAEYRTTLVSADEAEPIHSAVVRKEAWTQESIRLLRANADHRLKDAPWSVTTDRPKGLDLDPHEYYSESPYWWPDPAHPGAFVRRAGQSNPDRFTSNRAALDSMSDAVLSLGAAAFLLDDPRYAQHAARILQTWFINPKTRMNPEMSRANLAPPGVPPPGPAISEGRSLIWAIQGMEFLLQSGDWDPKDQAGVRKWFEEYLHWLAQATPAGPAGGGDAATWRAAIQAAAAGFVDDAAGGQEAFGGFRGRGGLRPPRTPGAPPDPAAPPFVGSLEARTTLYRIAQARGVDLWSARAGRSPGIASAVDRFIVTLSDPKAWSKDQLSDFESSGVFLLAFAGMGLNRPDYIAEYRKFERPGSTRLALVDLLTGRWEAAAHQTRH